MLNTLDGTIPCKRHIQPCYHSLCFDMCRLFHASITVSFTLFFLVPFSPGKGSTSFCVKHCNKLFLHVGFRKCNMLWFISSIESCVKCQRINTAVISIFLFISIDKTFGSWDISSAHICFCVESCIVQHMLS